MGFLDSLQGLLMGSDQPAPGAVQYGQILGPASPSPSPISAAGQPPNDPTKPPQFTPTPGDQPISPTDIQARPMQDIAFRGPPEMQHQPGILENLKNYITSPQGRLALGTALSYRAGNKDAFGAEQSAVQLQQQNWLRQQQLAAVQAKQAAMRSAMTIGPDGKLAIDPQKAAMAMLSSSSPFDPTNADDFKMLEALSPKSQVAGENVIRTGAFGGPTTVEGRLPMSTSDAVSIARLQEDIKQHGVENALKQYGLITERGQLGVAQGNEALHGQEVGLKGQEVQQGEQRIQQDVAKQAAAEGVTYAPGPAAYRSLGPNVKYYGTDGVRRTTPANKVKGQD